MFTESCPLTSKMDILRSVKVYGWPEQVERTLLRLIFVILFFVGGEKLFLSFF